jgi:hypothetical protein
MWKGLMAGKLGIKGHIGVDIVHRLRDDLLD